jgi:hypothetical protein
MTRIEVCDFLYDDVFNVGTLHHGLSDIALQKLKFATTYTREAMGDNEDLQSMVPLSRH